MSKAKPTLFVSPFGHLRYALALSKKHMKQLGVDKNEFLSLGTPAQAGFFNVDKSVLVVVQIGSTKKRNAHEVNAIIVHEAVHVWQEIREMMCEKEPSSEFEAYSIQKISLDLMSEFEELSKNG